MAAEAAPLAVVNVSAPAINCVYTTATPCTVTVSDSSGNIPLVGGGTGRLQSRTHVGQPGSAAAGLTAYVYRVDLTNAVGITAISCIQWVGIDIGPVVALDYNRDGRREHVYVVTGGGLGTIGLAEADQVGARIWFRFSTPVCAGSSRGRGATSFFFGLSARGAPRAVSAAVRDSLGRTHVVPARAPM
jgi:hypothetical protein